MRILYICKENNMVFDIDHVVGNIKLLVCFVIFIEQILRKSNINMFSITLIVNYFYNTLKLFILYRFSGLNSSSDPILIR